VSVAAHAVSFGEELMKSPAANLSISSSIARFGKTGVQGKSPCPMSCWGAGVHLQT
jgi:hypothetical protein